MGAQASVEIEISKELPHVKNVGSRVNSELAGVFVDSKDREQFVCLTYTDAVMTVLTSSSGLDVKKLRFHDIKLLYSRCGDKNDRLVASIVAIRNGVIDAKVVPDVDGADKREAFLALRKDVESKLDSILRQDSGSRSTTSNIATSSGSPPAYGSTSSNLNEEKAGWRR